MVGPLRQKHDDASGVSQRVFRSHCCSAQLPPVYDIAAMADRVAPELKTVIAGLSIAAKRG